VSAARLVTVAREALQAGETRLAEDIAKYLATLTDRCLDQMLTGWVATNHFSPPIAFRSAGPSIRDGIVASLASGNGDADSALSALAWIGDDVVQKAFLNWDAHRPPWTSRLYIPPSCYSTVAGWEIRDAKRRDLFFQQCLAVTPAEGVPDAVSTVGFSSQAQTCPWCEQQLSWMLAIEVDNPLFSFIQFSHPILPILTCHGCTCYGEFFAKIGADGTAVPHPMGARPKGPPKNKGGWGTPAWKNVPIALAPRRAIHAVDWCMPVKTSQIGGLPSWVQDPTYPKCPDCSETMVFLAQLSENDFPRHEGTYYAFLCAGCGTTATCYQQT
jgi:hypothetical protein